MPVGEANRARYAISSDSFVLFEAHSTLHAIKGKATGISGSVAFAWNPDGTLAERPAAQIRGEFPVDSLQTGNALQDREMRKVIDGRRFPKISADLRTLTPTPMPKLYDASGDVTMAGRSHRYLGRLSIASAGDGLTIEGNVAVDIRDFGLKPPNLLLVKVDPVVRVRLHLVATRTP